MNNTNIKEELLLLFKNNLNTVIDIPEKEWIFFSHLLKVKNLTKDQLLFQEEDSNLFVAFVMKGLLHSYYTSPDGKQVTKNFVWEGRAAGAWTSILQNKNAHFSCLAIEDSILMVIDAKEFLNLQKRHLCWVQLSKFYTEKILIEREIREYNSLTMPILGQYEVFTEQFRPIFNRLPQYLIASYLGISPVSLSRLLNKKTHVN